MTSWTERTGVLSSLNRWTGVLHTGVCLVLIIPMFSLPSDPWSCITAGLSTHRIFAGTKMAPFRRSVPNKSSWPSFIYTMPTASCSSLWYCDFWHCSVVLAVSLGLCVFCPFGFFSCLWTVFRLKLCQAYSLFYAVLQILVEWCSEYPIHLWKPPSWAGLLNLGRREFRNFV